LDFLTDKTGGHHGPVFPQITDAVFIKEPKWGITCPIPGNVPARLLSRKIKIGYNCVDRKNNENALESG
jgi:hypothetical protein